MARYLWLRLSALLARAARERRQLTRSEQLGLVMVFHVGIGFTALVIMVAFDAANHAPWGFYVCEGVIVFGCAAVTGRFPALQDFGRTVLGPPGERPKRRRRKARRRAGKESEVKLAERIAGIALAQILRQAPALEQA